MNIQKEVEADRLIDTRAVARLLGVAPGTVRNWKWRGRLPTPVMVSACLRWRESDILKIVRGETTIPAVGEGTEK